MCRALREEGLRTVIAAAEHTVDSRPLTYVTTDQNDAEALTPNYGFITRCHRIECMCVVVV